MPAEADRWAKETILLKISKTEDDWHFMSPMPEGWDSDNYAQIAAAAVQHLSRNANMGPMEFYRAVHQHLELLVEADVLKRAQ